MFDPADSSAGINCQDRPQHGGRQTTRTRTQGVCELSLTRKDAWWKDSELESLLKKNLVMQGTPVMFRGMGSCASTDTASSLSELGSAFQKLMAFTSIKARNKKANDECNAHVRP